jgi:lysyl-tRNA synthetase class II
LISDLGFSISDFLIISERVDQYKVKSGGIRKLFYKYTAYSAIAFSTQPTLNQFKVTSFKFRPTFETAKPSHRFSSEKSQKLTFADFYKTIAMLRTHTCGELNISNLGQSVTLCGWVQKSRDLGGTTFIDVRDRYGLTQLVFNTDSDAILREKSRELGREFVIKVTGKVLERSNKNTKIPTGEIEITVEDIEILNAAKLPPFLIEDETDGGEELRAKYRYLDLRRAPIRNNLVLRHKMAQEIRKYLDTLGLY